MSRNDYDFGQVKVTIEYGDGSRKKGVPIDEIPHHFKGPYNLKFGVDPIETAKDLEDIKNKFKDKFRPRNRGLVSLTILPDF